ncbi:hypothetical protein PHLCEN_2v8899 [Hermanssonia centrifuga]|uniref:Uncharacterized protein n=1 Tax=Hermanssonia centrifuga TaxID=98765 RepID=A0A2R6NSC9_9APHY|nr:hypothetical protein PHLCEN_2v8899 [Hermanssonia centrifuga]
MEDSSAPTTPVQFKESWSTSLDGASDCIPPSSSTVFPSSPYPQTPLDDLPSINPDALDHNVAVPYSVHRIYAPEIHAEKRDAGHELDGAGGAIEDFSPCIDGSLSPVVISFHSTDTSGHTFFSQNGSQQRHIDDELGLSPAINLDIHSGEAGNYLHTLDTHAAQVYFSLRLDRLLLQVLDEQNGRLTDKATFCPAVSPVSLFSLAQSASGLDSFFSASKSMEASDSLSHDNAIISAKASVDSSSVSSLSASHTSSRSISSSSVSTVLPATDQDSESSYEVFSPVRFTGRYVYDTHPDEGEDQECDGNPGILSSSSAGSDQVPSVEAEYSELWSSRNDPSLILRTPVTYPILDAASIVPLAPRKMQNRTRYLGPDACSQQSSLSKRSRPLSPLGSWEEYHNTDRSADMLHSPTCRDRRQEDSSYCQKTLAVVGLNEVNAPQTKKRKLATQDQAVMAVSHIPCRRDKEPTLGSLRRASSLRSDAGEVKARITDQPVTPVRSRFNNVTPSDSPLPILAPPPYEMIPRAPASKEQEAEWRISKLLSKELEERIGDGLNIAGLQRELMGEDEPQRQTHDDDDEEERMWRAVGEIEDSKTVDGQSENTEGRVTDYIEEADPSLGIEDEFRKEVIEWILDASPT